MLENHVVIKLDLFCSGFQVYAPINVRCDLIDKFLFTQFLEKEVRGRRDGGKGFVNWCIFICSSAALSAWRSIALDAGRHGVGRGGKFLDFCKNFTRPEMWTSMRGLVTPVGATPIDSKDQFE
ncbi:hypothetical protein T06_2152 [Trichinella sp. T6]|nr:hypothetical protein T06_2152 [Trichinella sp. T6]